jgi:hypothetical protein
MYSCEDLAQSHKPELHQQQTLRPPSASSRISYTPPLQAVAATLLFLSFFYYQTQIS